MKKTAVLSILFLVLFGWAKTDANAATTTFLSPAPDSVVQGAKESNDVIFWFFERQINLENDVTVDINTAGTYPVLNNTGTLYYYPRYTRQELFSSFRSGGNAQQYDWHRRLLHISIPGF